MTPRGKRKLIPNLLFSERNEPPRIRSLQRRRENRTRCLTQNRQTNNEGENRYARGMGPTDPNTRMQLHRECVATGGKGQILIHSHGEGGGRARAMARGLGPMVGGGDRTITLTLSSGGGAVACRRGSLHAIGNHVGMKTHFFNSAFSLFHSCEDLTIYLSSCDFSDI